MKKELNIGIGFVTGRSNVCNVINSYYSYLQDQMKNLDRKVNIVFYILFDLKYQGAEREDFYNLKPEIFNTPGITVRYITPEDIEEKKIAVQKYYKLDEEEVNLIFGNGHAKGRNTVMYYAYQEKMNYLLFWDDDEYPVACVKDDEGNINWKMQDNLLRHIEHMENENADVTIGYHCGYISPIPYMNYDTPEEEKVITDFIESISNEVVTWKSIKEKFEKNNGVTYANEKLSDGEGAYELVGEPGKRFVVGSTLCLNLRHIDKIPAFYNPPEARGEDAFFSMGLADSKIIKVPVYHFHDGFLKYREIMEEDFPKKLKLIKSSDKAVEKRFYKACLGWIKYKPLLMYLMDKENYKTKIESTHRKLKRSIKKIDSLYEKYDFTDLQTALEKYHEDVEKHYEEFLETNRVWKKLKKRFKEC